MRGRHVKVPHGDSVRPTQDMVRQALFSSLAAHIPGTRFLDLFAGSGAVGLEAWSRGAAYVCWVESDERTYSVLCANLAALCGNTAAGTPEQGWRTVKSDVFRFLKGELGTHSYETIFADPPYDRGGTAQWAPRLLQALAGSTLLSETGFFVMEQAADEIQTMHWAWTIHSSKTYGGTRLLVYRKAAKEKPEVGQDQIVKDQEISG